eukprot:jgi/Psemu1/30342/gm1.30342_g
MRFCKSNYALSLLLSIVFSTGIDGAPLTDNVFLRGTSADSAEELTLRARDSVLDERSRFAFNNDGYTGAGFIDFGGVGTSASWITNIPITGLYNVTIRYASKTNRGPLDLFVDNIKEGSFEINRVASNWNTWKDETIKVHMNAGNDRNLTLFASINPGPNVDKLTLKLVTPEPPHDPEEDFDYAIILEENECLREGQFEESENGMFDFGLNDGQLVVRNKATFEVLWSLKTQQEDETTNVCLQSNGNLVVLNDSDTLSICDTKSEGIYERTFGFNFGINNLGKIAVSLDNKHLVWTGGLEGDRTPVPTQFITPTPTESVSLAPVPSLTPSPTRKPTTGVPTPKLTTGPPTSKPTTENSEGPDHNNLEYKVVLFENNYFGKGDFARSVSGEFEVGLTANGNIVVRRSGKTSEIMWILQDSSGSEVVGDRFYLQNDGNLVMRLESKEAVWTSKTANSNGCTGYSFGVNNCGGVAAFLDSDPTDFVWTGGIQDSCQDRAPYESPTRSPILGPIPTPTLAPRTPDFNLTYSVILKSNGRLLERDHFVSSPNGHYEVGLDSSTGKLIIRTAKNYDEVWTLKDKNGDEVTNISKIYMQADGNLVMKSSSGQGLWNSETSKNEGGSFRINDDGQISVNFKGTSLWIDGLPREIYSGPPSTNLEFPVRGFFYYAVRRLCQQHNQFLEWYPETWTIGGEEVKYIPNLGTIQEGQYNSGDPVVVENHVKALDYAWADLSIVSWWGPSDRLDRARITQLLDETVAQGSTIKWTVYYEDEMKHDKSVDQLVADLAYLKEWFAWHEAWAHKNSKPVIFVWNEGDCEVAERWTAAAQRAGWYIVLKLFKNYRDCRMQPDSWHQYVRFFKADADEPAIPRVSTDEFCSWVIEMNASKRDWQLVVSFNEWGEGTAVESAVEWQSESGYGRYLDCLHDPFLYRGVSKDPRNHPWKEKYPNGRVFKYAQR